MLITGRCPACGRMIRSNERVRGWTIYTLYHEWCFPRRVEH